MAMVALACRIAPSGQQLAIQDGFGLSVPLIIADRDVLDDRPFVRIHGVGVDGIPIGIPEMFELPDDFAAVIFNKHFSLLQLN
jgi:hypothetical protein